MKPPLLQPGKRASDPEGLPVGSHRQTVSARALSPKQIYIHECISRQDFQLQD